MKLEGPVKKPLAIMLATGAVTVLLSGCAVAMLGGASRSGGSASGGSPASGSSGTASPAGRPASKIAADNSISTAVRSRFGANASLKPLKLTVDTHDGIVTLRGRVNDDAQRKAAQLEARAVSGVKAVKNELVMK